MTEMALRLSRCKVTQQHTTDLPASTRRLNMNMKASGNATLTTKKIWTQPVVKAIELSSARHSTNFGSDGGGAFTRS
jgi:hypothetical protein